MRFCAELTCTKVGRDYVDRGAYRGCAVSSMHPVRRYPGLQIAAPSPSSVLLRSDGSVHEKMTFEEIQASLKNCVTIGGSIGYRRGAAEKALADTIAFLRQSFAAVP